MASKKTIAPLTFDLPLSLIEKIAARQKKLGLRSASEVVREAVLNFDIEHCAAISEPHKQISVRLPADMKAKLARAARKKKVSIGELLRIAIEAHSPKASAKKAARK